MDTKKCSRCSEYMPRSEFYRSKRAKDGKMCLCKDCAKKSSMEYQRKKAYGIDDWSYNVLLENQDYRCLICMDHIDDLKTALAVDHNHKTGTIRGLLCLNCNVGISNLKDSPAILRLAAEYLEEFDE